MIPWRFEAEQNGSIPYQRMVQALRDASGPSIGHGVHETTDSSSLIQVVVTGIGDGTLNLYFTANDLYFRGYTVGDNTGLYGLGFFGDFDLADALGIPANQAPNRIRIAPDPSYGALARVAGQGLDRVSVSSYNVYAGLRLLYQVSTSGASGGNRQGVAAAVQRLIVVTSETARSQDIFTRATRTYINHQVDSNLSISEREEIQQWRSLSAYRVGQIHGRTNSNSTMSRLYDQLERAFRSPEAVTEALDSVAVAKHPHREL
ncbi:ribosome-inactivating family protein [Streptomyces sp. BHT-5-2]|uniref:ribosome-inactivating family protein n=1 Tax=Streptomyces sp. BHT-5-2 TaxID=2866715 RepID=UPI001C8D2EC4|nr:ribosome-inactivating family protein [Streptomyces sp. BHT-5-2]QZL04228.1 ribosome-inactivating family protein [Streptomyces sp. BHT-5-2]